VSQTMAEVLTLTRTFKVRDLDLTSDETSDSRRQPRSRRQEATYFSASHIHRNRVRHDEMRSSGATRTSYVGAIDMC